MNANHPLRRPLGLRLLKGLFGRRVNKRTGALDSEWLFALPIAMIRSRKGVRSHSGSERVLPLPDQQVGLTRAQGTEH